MIQFQNFIDGKWITKNDSKKYLVRNFNNRKVSSYPDSSIDDLKKAVDSSFNSFNNNDFYKNKKKRIKVLKEIYLYLKKNKKKIIDSELIETGKLINDTTNEISNGLDLWKSAIDVLKKKISKKNLNLKIEYYARYQNL